MKLVALAEAAATTDQRLLPTAWPLDAEARHHPPPRARSAINPVQGDRGSRLHRGRQVAWRGWRGQQRRAAGVIGTRNTHQIVTGRQVHVPRRHQRHARHRRRGRAGQMHRDRNRGIHHAQGQIGDRAGPPLPTRLINVHRIGVGGGNVDAEKRIPCAAESSSRGSSASRYARLLCKIERWVGDRRCMDSSSKPSAPCPAAQTSWRTHGRADRLHAFNIQYVCEDGQIPSGNMAYFSVGPSVSPAVTGLKAPNSALAQVVPLRPAAACARPGAAAATSKSSSTPAARNLNTIGLIGLVNWPFLGRRTQEPPRKPPRGRAKGVLGGWLGGARAGGRRGRGGDRGPGGLGRSPTTAIVLGGFSPRRAKRDHGDKTTKNTKKHDDCRGLNLPFVIRSLNRVCSILWFPRRPMRGPCLSPAAPTPADPTAGRRPRHSGPGRADRPAAATDWPGCGIRSCPGDP